MATPASLEEEEIDDTYSLCGSDFEYEGKAGYTCEPEYSKEDLEKLGKGSARRRSWWYTKSSKLWSPKKGSRVCSLHFIDGMATQTLSWRFEQACGS